MNGGETEERFRRCGTRRQERAWARIRAWGDPHRDDGCCPRSSIRFRPIRTSGRSEPDVGPVVSQRPEADRGVRPVVSCSSRACLPGRPCSCLRDAPSPLERVSSEKVRNPVWIFSGGRSFRGSDRVVDVIFAGWGMGDGGDRQRFGSSPCGVVGQGRWGEGPVPTGNAGSRRGAGGHRTAEVPPRCAITTAPRDPARHLARPFRRRC